MTELQKNTEKGLNKKMIVAAVVVVLVAVIIGVVINKMPNRNLTRQLDLGQKYLEDCEYEEAIVAFNTVIEIDDRCVEGYIGLTETYIRMGEFEKALEVAKLGYEKTADSRLQEYITMIESGNISRSDGKWMKKSTFDGAGRLRYSFLAEYDKTGRQSAVSHYDSNDNLVKRIELIYDEDGHQLVDYLEKVIRDNGFSCELIKMENIWENGKMMGYIREDGLWWAYEYDESGNQVKEISGMGDIWGKQEDIIGYYVNTYDEEGKIIRKDCYDSNGSLGYYKKFEYDEKGNIIMEGTYNLDDRLSSYWKSEYDENGKLVASYNYNGNGTLEFSQQYD